MQGLHALLPARLVGAQHLEALPPVGIGDESVSFSVVCPQDPSKGQTIAIVRTGGALAVYLTDTAGDPIPAALMKQQHEQLQKAG